MTSASPAKRFNWTNLGLRAASAAVLAPAVLAAVWWAGTPPWSAVFLLMIAAAVVVLSIEWAGMTGSRAPRRISALIGVAILAACYLTHDGRMLWAWSTLLAGAALAALFARTVGDKAWATALGVIYLGVPVVCLIWLRHTPDGRAWTIMLFAVTWAADIGAFVVGSVLKGPKLWPRYSPNKTWSGFWGGLGSAVLTGVLMTTFLAFVLNLGVLALITLAVGFATMAGDLWESALKRRFGVKDSGDLIPGHGGLLDRVDGLIFAAVVMAAAGLVNNFGLWGISA